MQESKEKPCRVCSDFKSWVLSQRKKNEINNNDNNKSNNSSNSNSKLESDLSEKIENKNMESTNNFDEKSEPPPSKNKLHQLVVTSNLSSSVFHPQCPADSEELGRSGWTVLHTMAAYFPEKPNDNTQKDMTNFMTLFSRLYPCTRCAKGLRKDLKNEPPDVSSRAALSQWMCRLHNKINEKLGKPLFDCKLVDERWRDGWKDGRCD